MAISPSTKTTPKQNEVAKRPETPLIDSWGSEVIQVFVGQEKKLFTVHQKLICQASKFFQRAMLGPFLESKTKDIYLPEEDPEYFDVFLHRLYRNELLPKMLFTSSDSQLSWIVGLRYYYPMIDRFLLDRSFKIEAINSFMRTELLRGPRKLGIFVAHRIIAAITEQDPLRQFVLDHVAFDCLLWDNGSERMDAFNAELSIEDTRNFAKSIHYVATKAAPFWSGNAWPREIKSIFCVIFCVEHETEWNIANIERYQTGYLKKPAE